MAKCNSGSIQTRKHWAKRKEGETVQKSTVWIIEGLMNQGYSIDESLLVLTEAKREIKSIRKFMDVESGKILLKDAYQQREDLMEELRKSARG